MDFLKFADLMKNIGFRNDEPIRSTFELKRNDLKNPVFRKGYPKVAGHYRVTSIWSEDGEVAFLAKKDRNISQLFPFYKEEVDFLAKHRRFRKN